MNNNLPPYNEEAPGLEVARPDEHWIYSCQAVPPTDSTYAIPVETSDEKIVAAFVSGPVASPTTEPLPTATRRSRKKFLIASVIGIIVIIVIILSVVLGIRANQGARLVPNYWRYLVPDSKNRLLP